MDKLAIVIATPSTGLCRFTYAICLARLVAYFAQVRVFPEVENQMLEIIGLESSGISSGRESLVKQALSREEMTHILFIDEDMGFDVDVLHTMARRRLPIVSANYRMRVPPADFTALRIDGTARIKTDNTVSGLEEAYYTGFGFSLISKEVLKAVQEPRFMIEYNKEHGRYTTEDHPFFRKAREAGFPCYVDHDASKKIWHMGNMAYRWDLDYTGLTLRQEETNGK